MRIARKYAPKVLLEFPASDWVARTPEEVTRFMQGFGAA
jgi:hypothetical protein